MKAKNLILSILFFIPSIFFACENYDEQERLQLIEGGETTDNTPITQKQEKVTLLLEDFTGWDCPNCPEGTEILNGIKDTYGEQVVVTAIHQGPFARPKDGALDLRTPYGDELGKGITSYPSLKINRSVISSTRGDWANAVNEYFETAQHLLNISLGAKITAENFIVVSTEIDVLENINADLLITLYVTESDIAGKQNDHGEHIEYLFQHVLRGNPIVDMPLVIGNAPQGNKINKSYMLKPAAGVNLDNSSVVVFVTDASNGKVLQANEIKLKR